MLHTKCPKCEDDKVNKSKKFVIYPDDDTVTIYQKYNCKKCNTEFMNKYTYKKVQEETFIQNESTAENIYLDKEKQMKTFADELAKLSEDIKLMQENFKFYE